VEREFLQLELWDQLDAREAEAVGRALGGCLPQSWTFDGVERHQSADQARQVAFLRWHEVRFALIPGGTVTLGYDRGRPYVSPPELLAEWEEHTQQVCGYPPLAQYLDERLTPLRRVALEPFLLEVEAHTWGEVVTVQGRRSTPCTLRQIRAALAADGFRLPTSDEWEQACAAGARTLFWWGEGGPPEPGTRNGFGLVIALNSYTYEACDPPGIWRGGDGGVASHGGDGDLAVWITLAPAWQDATPPREGDAEDKVVYSPDVRRAFSLPPGCLD
jgi:hypothetical protein